MLRDLWAISKGTREMVKLGLTVVFVSWGILFAVMIVMTKLALHACEDRSGQSCTMTVRIAADSDGGAE